MRISGFTIIELMITISIIVMMAVLSFPAFSSYQKKAELAQKTEELSGLINEMNVLVKNPEAGVIEYSMTITKDAITNIISKIDFNKDTSIDPIRSLVYETGNNLKAETLNSTSSITCSIKNNYCCVLVASESTCNLTTNLDRVRFYDDSITKQGVIKIKNNPFSVTYSYN